MSDSLPLLLVVCDGFRGYHEMRGDDVPGMVALAHGVHSAGHTCWLWDTRRPDTLVACSTAACFGCEREPECEFLGTPDDVGSPHDSSAFLADLLDRVGSLD